MYFIVANEKCSYYFSPIEHHANVQIDIMYIKDILIQYMDEK